MAQFTIRLELHDTDRKHYDLVHQKLHSQGFTHAITDRFGTHYKMPHAEYSYEGNTTEEAVLSQIKDTISQDIKFFGILVTKSAGRASYGLQQIDSALSA